MKSLLRSAALRLPPIRRLFAYAMLQERANHEQAVALEAMTAQREACVAEQQRLLGEEQRLLGEQQRLLGEFAVAAEERDALKRRLLGELAVAAEERDSLELQLYVLRSDHQRVAARNQELADAVHASEARVELALQEKEALARAQAAATKDDLSVLYGKLAGRLTLMSSAIERLVPRPAGGDGRALYLDLLERALTGMLAEDATISPVSQNYDNEIRMIGRDWPGTAQTMIGLARLRNLRTLTERVLQEGIPGDMLGAGVGRGGACILMRGVLAAHGVTDRTVWVADSFADLPEPDSAAFPADAGDQYSTVAEFRVSGAQAAANFQRYGLRDRQVRFLKGWFQDTLPASATRLAILRLDGDMYSLTMQTLDALYARVEPGGYVIVDDYIPGGCRQAVDEFRDRHGIADKLMEDIDGAAAFWRKS